MQVISYKLCGHLQRKGMHTPHVPTPKKKEKKEKRSKTQECTDARTLREKIIYAYKHSCSNMVNNIPSAALVFTLNTLRFPFLLGTVLDVCTLFTVWHDPHFTCKMLAGPADSSATEFTMLSKALHLLQPRRQLSNTRSKSTIRRPQTTAPVKYQ